MTTTANTKVVYWIESRAGGAPLLYAMRVRVNGALLEVIPGKGMLPGGRRVLPFDSGVVWNTPGAALESFLQRQEHHAAALEARAQALREQTARARLAALGEGAQLRLLPGGEGEAAVERGLREYVDAGPAKPPQDVVDVAL